MKRLLVTMAVLAGLCTAAWAGGVGTRCTTDAQCTGSGIILVCNSYWHVCAQPGTVGTHCLRDADCRSPLYCSAKYNYTCQQR